MVYLYIVFWEVLDSTLSLFFGKSNDNSTASVFKSILWGNKNEILLDIIIISRKDNFRQKSVFY